MYGFDDPFRIDVTVRLRVESPGKSEDLKSSERNLLTLHFTSDRAWRMLKSFCSSLCGDFRCKEGVFTEELGNGAVQLHSSGWALQWTGVFGSIFNYRVSTSAILDITAAI